jgi:cullin 3
MNVKKDFRIQSFRQQPRIDHNGAQELWTTLRKAINEIYNQNASQLSYEELYRNAYNLVLHKHYELLYEGVKNAIRDHLAVSLAHISEAKNEEVVAETVKAWSFHSIAFNLIKDIMMYMDRSYCIPRKKAPVYTLSLQLFRESLIYEPTHRERLRTTVLQEILQERQGRVIDRPLLKSYLGMLVDLGVDGVKVYDEEFERYFLEETRSFYKVESLAFLSENTCPDYVAKAEARLAEEVARVRHYLSPSTEAKLKQVAEHELIAVHAKALLDMENTGFVCMLRDNKLGDLQRIYGLFARLPNCLEQLRDAMFRYIKQTGLEIVASQETSRDPVAFVKAILDLKGKFDNIIATSFRSEKAVQKKLNEAFEGFINVGNHCAAHLASYVDELLRGGIQGATEVEVEDKLEKVIVIFKFLSDKDIFESYYKNLLCKRLLGGKTVSDEVEKQMIAKFKAECGYQFTTKLEGMFLDMGISKGVQDEFRASPLFQRTPVPMEVHVLTTGYWPLIPSPPCRLPADLQQGTTVFTAFYLGMNSGRKLTWLTHLGSVDLKVTTMSPAWTSAIIAYPTIMNVSSSDTL